MWRKDPSTVPTPPEPTGEPICHFDRDRGEKRLEVRLQEYEGHPFVSVRVWARGQDGALWPTKSGLSIRMRELPELVQALQELAGQGRGPAHGVAPRRQGGARRAEPAAQDEGLTPRHLEGQPEPDHPQFVDRRRRPEPRDLERERLTRPVPSDEPFVEFKAAKEADPPPPE